jgi:hypothetical protein
MPAAMILGLFTVRGTSYHSEVGRLYGAAYMMREQCRLLPGDLREARQVETNNGDVARVSDLTFFFFLASLLQGTYNAHQRHAAKIIPLTHLTIIRIIR